MALTFWIQGPDGGSTALFGDLADSGSEELAELLLTTAGGTCAANTFFLARNEIDVAGSVAFGRGLASCRFDLGGNNIEVRRAS